MQRAGIWRSCPNASTPSHSLWSVLVLAARDSNQCWLELRSHVSFFWSSGLTIRSCSPGFKRVCLLLPLVHLFVCFWPLGHVILTLNVFFCSEGIGSILFLKHGLKKFCRKNYRNHLRRNNYEVCTAVARRFPNILDVIVLENIKISLQIKIGRPPYWSNDRDLVFCHQSFIYAFSSVYFNRTLILYVHWT
jgi:hypothetical protein